MKRILILGGSPFQIPVIEYARKAGHYVITCDYLPDNPGHKLAHEYHNVSTTDLEHVLELSVRSRIDGILAYASDPAAPTAAYVAERLGLPGNPYESVCLLTEKDRYRRFLIDHGFSAPQAVSWPCTNGAAVVLEKMSFPIMVKPVDSSGSKGVTRVEQKDELASAVDRALKFSRCKRAVLEEFVNRKGPQIGGEAFVLEGKLVCLALGDQMVDRDCNPFVPTGMTFPSRVSQEEASKIRGEIQRLLDALHYSVGGLNLEIMLDATGRVYLMEIGPRTGGNYLPELVHFGTGFNLAGCSVEAALGNPILERLDRNGAGQAPAGFAYHAVHSRKPGVLKRVEINSELKRNIVQESFFKQPGDPVETYNGSNCTIGILLLRFETEKEMRLKMDNVQELVRIDVGEADLSRNP